MARVAVVSALCLAAVACHETGEVKVASLSISGNQAFSSSDLKKLLVTQATGRWPWSKPSYFNREAFEADLKRLTAFYTDRGYPDAAVAAMSVDFTPERDAVHLTIELDEGTPLLVEQVVIHGLDTVAEDVQQSVSDLPLKRGAPRDRAIALESRERLVHQLRDRGYAYASARMSERDGTQPGTVVVEYTVDPGPLSAFGPVSIQGQQTVSDAVVRRTLSFRTGDLFRESLVLESQRRLNGLGLFDFALVDPQVEKNGNGTGDASTQLAAVPVQVTVAEGPPQLFQIGVGYGTEDGARGSFNWQHANLLGGAQHITLDTKYSTRLRGGGLEFTQPYFFTRRLSYSARTGGWWTDEPTYNSRTYGGRFDVVFQQQIGRGLDLQPIDQTVRVGYSHDALRYAISPETLRDLQQLDQLVALGLDPVAGSASGRLAAMNAEYQRRAVDRPLDPHRGYSLRGQLMHAATWLGGTFRFDELDLEGSVYVPVAPQLVWATRVRAAAMFAETAADVPFSERYFLGGATSMRGWGRFQVSPLTEEGLPIGGRAVLDTSTELRMMFGQFGAVVFVDAGQVWADSAGLGSSPLLLAVGPGLRWASPIGIVRADVGVQLRRIPGLLVNGAPETRRWRIHFSIGHAF